MCRRTNPELQKRMMLEMAEEIRKWFREWRRRITVADVLGREQAGARPPNGWRGS